MGVRIEELCQVSKTDAASIVRLTASVIPRSSARLLRMRYDLEKEPYLVKRQTPEGLLGIGLANSVCISVPRTAAVVKAFITFSHPSNRMLSVNINQFVESLGRDPRFKPQADYLPDDITFLIDHFYITRDINVSGAPYYFKSSRVDKEIVYLKNLTTLYDPDELIMPYKPVSALTERQAIVLMQVWHHEGWQTNKFTPAEAQRRGIEVEKIASQLNLESESICGSVSEIDSYQQALIRDWSPVIVIEKNATDRPSLRKVRFARESIITFPETAALAIYLFRHPVPHTALADAKQHFPATADRDFLKLAECKYALVHDGSLQLTKRIEYEFAYLEKVASFYSPRSVELSANDETLSEGAAQVLDVIVTTQDTVGGAGISKEVIAASLPGIAVKSALQELEGWKWPVIDGPRRVGTTSFYKPADERVVTWPETARWMTDVYSVRYLSKVQTKPQRIHIDDFTAYVYREYNIELGYKDLEWCANAEYIALKAFSDATKRYQFFWPRQRISAELSYLRILACRHKNPNEYTF